MAHDHDHPHPHPHPHEHPHPATGGITLSNAKPTLSVASVPASLAYYRDVLGFTLNFAWADATQFAGGAPPTFAEVSRGGCEIKLAQPQQGAPGMWVHVDVESWAELEALYHEYQHSGARIREPPADRPWGRREMRGQDLDGHTFRLSAPHGK